MLESLALILLLQVLVEEVTVTAEEPADSASAGIVPAAELERKPLQRPADVLESVPGLTISQHSGEGKANQYYLRGFNLDHGTDLAIDVAGVPVNMPTHGHGQGYADLNFLIPELIGDVAWRKGPYFADAGDFASAGQIGIGYATALDRPLVVLQAGQFGYQRLLAAASRPLFGGVLLGALETVGNDGPWERPDALRKNNALVRFTRGGGSVAAMLYDARWNATDQIPDRAVRSGALSRFGLVDDTNGGETHRYSLSGDWQRARGNSVTQFAAYALDYRLDLFSNFTYFLDDPVNGDQFEQLDDRRVFGGSATHRWSSGAAGVQLRRDEIDRVGLYRTSARQRLSTANEAALAQTSGGVWAQQSIEWSPRVRTVIGARADRIDARRSDSLVSPKASLIFGPWRNVELYLNAGSGFHSNDARTESDDLLVRTRGAEAGVRAQLGTAELSASFWRLDAASELLFVGDAGTTEARGASRRAGVELTGAVRLTRRVAIDADLAWSRARFRNGDRIPGAVEGVAAVGLSLTDLGPVSAELRYRYFGPRPLVEDNRVRSQASSLVSARASYAIA
ncbi:MAG TPA: TonB-dependent receptor, partial [Thermoanaerobaculia bacterium]|nr:TonB-dependent receptor [Thermoanaerobaculia bacterium]